MERWQKERAVNVSKANNKFLLISFDKLQSDSFLLQNSKQGFVGRTEQQLKFNSLPVTSAMKANFEEVALTFRFIRVTERRTLGRIRAALMKLVGQETETYTQ